MQFQSILGQNFIKKHLTTSVDRGRVAHAQLFVGASGSGVLPCALAYAQYLICNNTEGENTGGSAACNLKFDHLAHPDLHFAYPVAPNDTVKSHPVSDNFAKEWRAFIQENPYGSLYDWHRHIGIEKKQGKIGVDEAQDIVKKLSLKSYEGGFKVMIIWMADKMNNAASNKLLKLIEEPPQKTIFLLIAENEDQIIDTIKSRCQVLRFPPLAAEALENALITEHNCDPAEAKKLAIKAHGDYNLALHLLDHSSDEEEFETWFVSWVRTAFKARGNKKAIIDLIAWSENIASKGRETQKSFLGYCEDFFRQAMLLNYNAKELVYLQPVTQFELAKFAPFIHGNNINSLIEELQTAAYHIERNGNAKIVLTDLSIKLTRLLHTKA
ncbi:MULTISPECIES: DNA polymerase III subunit [Leeuwenhoekiella]|jgi:DNA polymerase-3 subunit delta'|uniref:DNA polymerase III subunit n=2 Tax=Flavobacteriaceae TaxID=49546 RepID=UPI000C53FBA0|nr:MULTISPECIES: DNA polymerase III subunit delta' [Leeuwenhoekiella]MAO45272.1 DNA polymerase III subunit delta' [Leeuwenhoekiella sp.]HCW65529.1 DNA polymerase III subunit delta' [Leeuwenhoekiella sp.]|tara:strand:+ start:789 stop:1937 length:1149 start_codon:yes stop_codon:yes gene_type:complete